MWVSWPGNSFRRLEVILVITVVIPAGIVGIHGYGCPAVGVHKQVRRVRWFVRIVVRIVVVLGMVLRPPTVVDIRPTAVRGIAESLQEEIMD